MTRISKRLILSIVTLVLIVFAVGTTTFAWFTLSARATIGDITGEIVGEDGLQIALGVNNQDVLTEYRTNVRADDWQIIMNQINKDLENSFKFGAVSTTNGIFFDQLVVEERHLETRLNKEESKFANIEGSYLEFNVFFKSGTAGSINWVDYGFVDNDKTTRQFTPDVTYYQSSNEDMETKNNINVASSNAARIGVSKLVEKTIGSIQTIVEEPVIVQKKDSQFNNTVMPEHALDYGQFSYLYNKGNDVYWENGLNVYSNLMNIVRSYTFNEDKKIDYTNPPLLSPNQMFVEDVEIAKAHINIETIGQNIVQLKRVDPDILATQTDVDNNLADNVGDVLVEGDLSKAYAASVTVRAWLEGWDVDAYDSIFQLGLNFNLTFKKGPALNP